MGDSLRKIWLELDVAGTLSDAAWVGLDQPKGYIDGGIFNPKKVNCEHHQKEPHTEGEWREVWVHIEDLHFDSAVHFYKEKLRILAVEVED